MEKRTGFKMGDSELTLLGKELKVGDKAPDFTVVKQDLSPYTLKDMGDVPKILIAVPSVDTGVCEMETIRFNEEAKKLGDKVALLTVSMDLPFAQQRFCAQKGIDNLVVASDYQNREFAEKYGVLIDGLCLTNRSIFVLDKDNTITYLEYVPQNTDHPNYDGALEAVNKLI